MAKKKTKGSSKTSVPQGATSGLMSGFMAPPIKIFGEKLKECHKDDSLTIKLKSNPSDDSSGTCESTVSILDGSETPWQCIHWRSQLDHIWTGQNIDTAKNKLEMARRCMTAQPLTVLNQSVTKLLKNDSQFDPDDPDDMWNKP